MTAEKIVNVGLTPMSENSLKYIQKAGGYSEADAVNRALQAYELILRRKADGHKLAFATQDAEGEVVDIEVYKVD